MIHDDQGGPTIHQHIIVSSSKEYRSTDLPQFSCRIQIPFQPFQGSVIILQNGTFLSPTAALQPEGLQRRRSANRNDGVTIGGCNNGRSGCCVMEATVAVSNIRGIAIVLGVTVTAG